MAITYTLINSATAGNGGSAYFEFVSIPNTYTDLLIKVSARATAGGDSFAHLLITFNSSNSSYTNKRIQGSGSTAASSSDGTTYVYQKYGINGSASTASVFGNMDIYIPDYTSSNYKSLSSDSVTENNANEAWINLNGGLWSNTAAITSIKLEAEYAGAKNLAEHSTAYLYGIKNS